MDNLLEIANQFKSEGRIVEIEEYGEGNINRTFLVTLDTFPKKYFILQRLNTQVFRQPKLVMQNIRIFSDHVGQRLQSYPLSQSRRWQVPRVLLTQDQQDYWVDPNNFFWRALSFIENATTFDTIQDRDHASEVGYALGMFHNLISDLPTSKLADTLPGFHITPSYLAQYQQVLSQTKVNLSTESNHCLRFISDRSSWANVLENAKAQGILNLRPIHGDPKVNNIMIDANTKQAISLIDLDTVKPGLIHYDLGDCLRSCCNLLGEETQNWQDVTFDTDICQSVLKGYLSVAKNFLTDHDYEYIYVAIRLIAFELGLRFFSDYLAGNIYFKTKYPEHNLHRALVQFQLTNSIENQENSLRRIIHESQ